MKTLARFGLALLVSTTSAWAFGTKGGGSVIVCFDQNPEIAKLYYEERKAQNVSDGSKPTETFGLKSVAILDEHLAKATRIVSLDLSEAEDQLRGRPDRKIRKALDRETPDEFVERLIKEVFDLSYPPIAEVMRKAARAIRFEDSISKQHGIMPQDDFSSVGLIDRARCVLTNLFVQEKIAEQHFLYRDDRIWNHEKLSDLSRLVTYLHEVVYWVQRSRGDVTSDVTRKVTQALVIEYPSQSWKDFFSPLSKLKFIDVLPQEVGESLLLDTLAWDHYQYAFQLIEEDRERHFLDVIGSLDEQGFGLPIGTSAEGEYKSISESFWYSRNSVGILSSDIYQSRPMKALAFPLKDLKRWEVTKCRWRIVSSEEEKEVERQLNVLLPSASLDRVRSQAMSYFQSAIVPRIKQIPIWSAEDQAQVIKIFEEDIQSDFPGLEIVDHTMREGVFADSVIEGKAALRRTSYAHPGVGTPWPLWKNRYLSQIYFDLAGKRTPQE